MHGRIDWMNNALESFADQVLADVIADRRVILIFPDYGNALRIEEDIKVLLRHTPFPILQVDRNSMIFRNF
jgi:hypothetical protein